MKCNSHKRKEVSNGDGAPFFFDGCTLLYDGVNRDDKKSSDKAKKCDFHCDGDVADARLAE